MVVAFASLAATSSWVVTSFLAFAFVVASYLACRPSLVVEESFPSLAVAFLPSWVAASLACPFAIVART